jgi:CHAD domain-containing protein
VVSEHLEVERKYDVDAGFTPPSPADLAGLPDVAAVDPPAEHQLEAGYFDTADLRLFRARVTLRRRTGGPDAGWHLKLPADGGARRELHAPLGRSVRKPPAALLAPVAGLLRGATVEPIATLRTRRVVTALRDADGRVLAEIADDTVTATVLPAGTDEPLEVQTWREVEAELVDGAEPLLMAVGERLTAAGAAASPRASKLGRAIASRTAGTGRASGKRRKPRAGDVVLDAVRAEVSELQAADIGIRTDGPDAVHRFRVAARRSRSLLVASRPVLERTATDPLRAELSWLRGELDRARDEEVALAQLRALVAEEPRELVLGPVAARLQQAALKAAEDGRGDAARTLSDPRYLRLLDGLHDLLDEPPWTGRAGDAVRPVLRDVLRRAARRVERPLEGVGGAEGADLDEALHAVRTSAKRLRDVAELAQGDLGRPARKLARATKQVQQILGERQDTVVTRDLCRRLAVMAHAAGENTFAYGRLHALEQFRADRAWSAFEALEPTLRPAVVAAAKKR